MHGKLDSSFIKGCMLRVRSLAAGYSEVGWKVGCRQQPFGDWPFSREQYGVTSMGHGRIVHWAQVTFFPVMT